MVKKNEKTIRSRKWNDLLQFLILIGIIVFANIIASQFFFRLDLTEENRYSINPATKQLLRNLDDVVYVEVYLEGEFPAGFKRLQQSIRETLDEFRIYAGDNVQYKFVDPSASGDVKSRNEYYLQLAKKGIQPTNLTAMEGDQRVEKIIFPGAVVSYREKEIPVMLLKGNQAVTPEQRLNQSVEGVEYELASAIRKLSSKSRKKIVFLEGHGELDVLAVNDMMGSLQQYYDVERKDIRQLPDLKGYHAIVVAKPDTTFNEYDKFKIDQFIMNGGKAMFFLDAMNINLDSIGEKGTLAFPITTGLEDMLFKYGVRINHDLIQDVNAAYIPMMVGYVGNQPQTQLVSWRFFPLINSFSKHAITKNMDAVYTRFVSTIDTVKAVGITKTPLMFTSKYSRVLPSPVRVNFNEARININPKAFNKGPLPVGYLLEGEFESLYKNRVRPGSVISEGFISKGQPTKIVVFSDGDLIRSEINKRTNEPYALGFDRFTRMTFANRELAMNAMDYLLDESGLINVRTKEVTLRPLDKIRVAEEKTKWQVINLAAPLIALILFGIIRYYLRKRRFENLV